MKATFISKTDSKYNFGQTLEIINLSFETENIIKLSEVRFDGEKKTTLTETWKILPYDCYYLYPLYHELIEIAEKNDLKRKLEDVI